jgi:Mn-containing catalase
MTVAMQYLFQGWNCRMPGKYKDLIMDVATEEMGHVEMIATMVARLLEGAPATATTKAAAADPVVGAVHLARDTLHQNLWLKAIEELQADGLETTVAPNALFDEEYAEHATSVWHLSDGTAGQDGGWASGMQPDRRHEFGYLPDRSPSVTWARSRHRTRSCTQPTTAAWAIPAAGRWAPKPAWPAKSRTSSADRQPEESAARFLAAACESLRGAPGRRAVR